MAETITRFWNKVDKTTNCWNWKAGKFSFGYGAFYFNGHNERAHRFLWELVNGPIPKGLKICHSCDNPPCVRPEHLFLGTQKENIQDAIKKHRIIPSNCNQPAGENNGRAILTLNQVQEIKEIYSQKSSKYNRKISQRKLARMFNVSRRTIDDILKERTWTMLLK